MEKYSHLSRKELILRFLQDAGNWCSGQDIADGLGISRAAVAKHVNSLRADGHVIDSATKRGYRFVVEADVLTLDQIVPHLATQSFGRSDWHFLPVAVSTSNELIALAMQGAAEGTVIAAEEQTQGKGRKGHAWFSAPRALQFSVLVRPVADAKTGEYLMRAAVVAVAQALAGLYQLDVCVKGPNDVLINSRKVAGVLIESGYRSQELDWMVIGIGCNVNTLPDEFPLELKDKATSIYAETGQWISRNRVLAHILNALERWYLLLARGDLDKLEEVWAQFHA